MANGGGFGAWQSRLLGSLMERLVRLTGGRCLDQVGLRVCRVGRVRLFGRSGTQWGDIFVTGSDTELTPGLIKHETHHRDAQWRRWGLAFGLMYLVAEVWDVHIRRLSCNRYERAAEDASDGGGGYPPQ